MELKAKIMLQVLDPDLKVKKVVTREGKVFVFGEKEIDLFPIGVLAEALGRTTQTLQLWEKEGYMPKPMYKVSGYKCTRWYSRAQIMGMAEIMKKFNHVGSKNRYFDKDQFFKIVKEKFYLFEAEEELKKQQQKVGG